MWDPEAIGEQFEELGEIAILPEFSPDFDFSDSFGDFGVNFSDFSDIDFSGGGFDFSDALNNDNFAERLGETLASVGDAFGSSDGGFFSGSSDSGSSLFIGFGGGDSGGGGTDWFGSSD